MTKAARVRALAASGLDAQAIEAETGFDRRTVWYALHTPAKPIGRPRVERCEHCGQPIPSKLADLA